MSHTKEPWEVDHRECDGVRYFVMLGTDGKTIMDTMNSESQEIHEDFDENGFRDQWDEQGKLDLNRAAKCVNACAGINPEAVPDLLAVCKLVLPQMEIALAARIKLTGVTTGGLANKVAALKSAINKAEGGL